MKLVVLATSVTIQDMIKAARTLKNPEYYLFFTTTREWTKVGKRISETSDPDFARDVGLSWILRLVMTFLSYGIRRKAKRRNVSYSFLFMRANGDQLREIASLIDSRIIRPVVDRVYPLESAKEALAYVEKGHAKGKVVVKMR